MRRRGRCGPSIYRTMYGSLSVRLPALTVHPVAATCLPLRRQSTGCACVWLGRSSTASMSLMPCAAQVLAICQSPLDYAGAAELVGHAKSHPIVAAGVLVWLRDIIGTVGFFRSFSKRRLPLHFAIVDEVRWRGQRARVLRPRAAHASSTRRLCWCIVVCVAKLCGCGRGSSSSATGVCVQCPRS